MIASYDGLTLGKYREIRKADTDPGLDELGKQVRIISILSGISEDEVLHLPLPEYTELARRADFLRGADFPVKQVAKRYLVGGFELYPVRDYRRLETGQYIDFQTYVADMDDRIVELVSVLLVPKGKRYGEGYDIIELQKAIADEMSVTDGVSVVAFFLTWFGRSIQASLDYSEREATRMEDGPEKTAILERIAAAKAMASPGSGDGSRTSTRSAPHAGARGTRSSASRQSRR